MMSKMMRSDNKIVLVLLFLLAALLVACGSTATPESDDATDGSNTTEGNGQTDGSMEDTAGDSDAVTAAATAHLAAELGIGEDEIQVISAQETEFTDSCLGLGRLDESCLQALTPGWLVVLDAAGQTYELHTDATGDQVRLVETME